ncbi:hypothetical protein FGF1_36380 [Flavobacteriaceae bacterium GF1]
MFKLAQFSSKEKKYSIPRARPSSVVLLVGLLFLWACNNDDDGAIAPEFFISGDTQNTTLTYEQTIFDGGSNNAINTFSKADKTTTLQTFREKVESPDGFWTIRMVNLDIEELNLPYTLKRDEGTISWIDESIKELQSSCSRADVLCFYAGIGDEEVKITISSVENGIVEGHFTGRLFHYTINPTVTKDENDFIEVSQGKFVVRYLNI